MDKIPVPRFTLSRANLQYEVREKKGKACLKEIIELVKKEHLRHSGIVYCLSRKECDSVAQELNGAGLRAVAYHAGLGMKDLLKKCNLD